MNETALPEFRGFRPERPLEPLLYEERFPEPPVPRR
jgi:hypothetical protein